VPRIRPRAANQDSFLAVTIAGLVIGADNALLTHEAERRQSEHAIRREARMDLARRGLIATETEIAKWRVERTRQLEERANANPS
jgi:hypothetical protein